MERKTDEDDKKDDEDNDNKGGCCCPERWVLAVLGFFGFIFVYALRVNLSVAIVCMVRPENSTLNSTDTQCSALDAGSDLSSRGEFDWDKNIQSGMLSSFFYGYMVTQIPGGWLAGRFGGKMVIWTGMLIVATANLLLPELARVDYRFVYGLRALMGLAQGVSFPSMHAMWGKWAPPVERSRLASLTYAGLMVGNIVTFIFSGYLCKYGFDNGWGSVFYVTGGAAFIWLLAWWIVVSDTPESNPRISRAEREYIQKSIGDIPNKQYTIPWKAMLTSQALFACLVAHVCNNWTHYTLVTSLPTFMKEALHYNIEENGLLSAVPYMSMLVTSLTVSHVADFVRSHWLSTRVTRRLFQVIAFSGICGCLIGTGFIDCENRTYAVVMLALAVGFEGLCYSGYVVNHIDFAPRYAGVLYGITNMFSTIPGIVAPEVAGTLTPNKTQEEWRNVFFVCGGFAIFGAIVFGFCAQGELEPWAKEEGDDLSQEIVVSSEYGSRDNIAFDSKSSLDDYAIEENGLSGTRL